MHYIVIQLVYYYRAPYNRRAYSVAHGAINASKHSLRR